MVQFIVFGGPGVLLGLGAGVALARRRRALLVVSAAVVALLFLYLVWGVSDDDPGESQIPLTILLVAANLVGWLAGVLAGVRLRRGRA